MSRTVLLALMAALVTLTACAQRVAPPTPELDPELGVGPVVADEEPTPLASPDVTGTPASQAPSAADDPTRSGASPAADPESSPPPAAAGQPDPSPAPTAAPSPAPRAAQDPEAQVLLAVADRAGDHGLQGPDWADLTSLEVVEVGNDLRVTLRFAGQLPSPPPEGQVPLVNVDIGEGDRAYQLHVQSDGRGEAWAAYLYTPQGFVQYPGTFTLAGSAMVLQVPFNAVGSPTRAPVRVLVEWSEDRALLNAASEDRLDGQPHTFDRNP